MKYIAVLLKHENGSIKRLYFGNGEIIKDEGTAIKFDFHFKLFGCNNFNNENIWEGKRKEDRDTYVKSERVFNSYSEAAHNLIKKPLLNSRKKNEIYRPNALARQ